MKSFKEIRSALGLTKKEVCEGAEISYFNLNNIESEDFKGTKAYVVANLMIYYRNNHQIDLHEIAL